MFYVEKFHKKACGYPTGSIKARASPRWCWCRSTKPLSTMLYKYKRVGLLLWYRLSFLQAFHFFGDFSGLNMGTRPWALQYFDIIIFLEEVLFKYDVLLHLWAIISNMNTKHLLQVIEMKGDRDTFEIFICKENWKYRIHSSNQPSTFSFTWKMVCEISIVKLKLFSKTVIFTEFSA